MRRCQQHKAPQYLIDCVTPASDIASRQRLRCASLHQLLVRVTNSANTVVGPSLSLDQRLGIRCRLTSAIRRVVTSLSDAHWKHSCSLSTSVSSALEVSYDDALYKSTLSVCMSVCLSVYLSIYLSVCLFVCLSVCLSIYLSIYLSNLSNLSICLSVCLSVYLTIYLSI